MAALMGKSLLVHCVQSPEMQSSDTYYGCYEAKKLRKYSRGEFPKNFRTVGLIVEWSKALVCVLRAALGYYSGSISGSRSDSKVAGIVRICFNAVLHIANFFNPLPTSKK